ncbi:hypothetical protein CJ195_11900 [Bacillus sp. UMB0899]|nr:hypothetical protein CJ195_11900 [Bacillus sp. UMB0899]
MVGKKASNLTYIQMTAPPLPHYVNSGVARCEVGEGHAHRKDNNVFDLIVVYKGALHIEEEGIQWTIRPGQALILNPIGQHFSHKLCTERTSFYWLHFNVSGTWKQVTNREYIQSTSFDRSVKRLNNFTIHIPKYYNLGSPDRTYTLIEKLNLMMGQPGEYVRWREQSIFQDIIREINEVNIKGNSQSKRDKTSSGNIAEMAAKYLRENYKNDINYKSLEEALSYNRTYISRCMKKIFNITPTEYLKQYRLEQAKLQLINTNDSIALIAESVGFNNVSYFIKCFNDYEKLSPKLFRDKYHTLTTYRWDIVK